jgi:hypothetical protein
MAPTVKCIVRVVAVCLFLGSLVSGDIANAMSLRELHGYCVSRSSEQYALCVGYVMGVLDLEETRRQICPRATLTNQQKVDAIGHHLDLQSDTKDGAAPSFVSESARQLYRCADRRQKTD